MNLIGGLQCLLITSLLITPQKTCHGGPYFDWLLVQGHWVRVGVLFLIKGAIIHLHTSEMRRRFRKGFQMQSQIAPTLSEMIKKSQKQISDIGKSGAEFAHSRCAFKNRGFYFSFVFAGCASTRWQASPNTFHSSHKLDRACVAVALLSSSVSSFQCLHPASCIHLSSSFVNFSQLFCSD